MDKPTGTFWCVACEQAFDGSELLQNPDTLRWSCGNLGCGANAIPIPMSDEQANTTHFLGTILGEMREAYLDFKYTIGCLAIWFLTGERIWKSEV